MSDMRFIVMPGAEPLGKKMERVLKSFHDDDIIIDVECPRFQTGESKGVLKQSVRGKDIYILIDITASREQYQLRNKNNCMSPDDHFSNLKRVINAMSGKAERITIIMPFLYESRQHKRGGRESLDCAMALKELEALGVDNIITLDAHHLEVINAVPTMGFESISAAYQFLRMFLSEVHPKLSDVICISPDEGGTNRAVKLANMMHCDMAMFYKRRDCSVVIGGKNPIVEHVYLGPDPTDKICVIVDDMISSGGSVLATAKELKDKGASKVYVFTTFGLFTEGTQSFSTAYLNEIIDGVYCTNACQEEAAGHGICWYHSVDVSEYLVYIMEAIHKDASISYIIEPNNKIVSLIEDYDNK